MNDAAIMRRDKPLYDLQRVIDSKTNRQCSFRQSFAKGLALEQFTNNVRRSLVEANVINRNDVGMIQRRRRARFQFKTAEGIGVVAGSGAGYFQSDIATQSVVAGAKNLAHGSSADLFENLIVTYDLSGHAQGRPC